MMLVVTFKYVLTIMKADNKGEGGSLALLPLISRSSGGARWTWPIVLLGVFATALSSGDSMSTPAISVLSATEGLSYVHAGFHPSARRSVVCATGVSERVDLGGRRFMKKKKHLAPS